MPGVSSDGDRDAPGPAVRKRDTMLQEKKDDEAGRTHKIYRCGKCSVIMVQIEALICLDEEITICDWQGHLPLSCNNCYNESVVPRERLATHAWEKKGKALWLKRKWANGEQEKRSRNMTFEETRQQLAAEFRGRSVRSSGAGSTSAWRWCPRHLHRRF